MLVGTEWLIDASGCTSAALCDLHVLRALCERIVAELELHVIGHGVWHQFPPPGGLTGLYLLSESHLACHSYPEHGIVTFNLHCCRSRPRWCWETALRDALGASAVSVREVARGPGGAP